MRKNKFSCGYCEMDTRLTQFPVHSNIYKKRFCDMECFNLFYEKVKKENKDKK